MHFEFLSVNIIYRISVLLFLENCSNVDTKNNKNVPTVKTNASWQNPVSPMNKFYEKYNYITTYLHTYQLPPNINF